MSNASLQEQLQAFVCGPDSERDESKAKEASSPKQPAQKPSASKPNWLEHVFYGLELLKAHYPLCFKDSRETQPLKVGIKQDLVKRLGSRDDIVINDKACMIKSLSYYVNTINYYKNVFEGALRIDLNGQPAGTVTAEEALYSSEQYQAKLQKKSSRSLSTGKKLTEKK